MRHKTGKKVRSKRTGEVFDLWVEKGLPIEVTNLDSETREYIPGNEFYFINDEEVDKTANRLYLNGDTNEEFEET